MIADSEAGGLPAQAAEDGERVLGRGLPDHLPAWLRLAVHALGERVRLVLGRDADDQVAPAANDGVPLALELVGERVGLAVRRQLDPHLPRGMAVLELLR